MNNENTNPETPKADAPKAEAPKTEAPKAETKPTEKKTSWIKWTVIGLSTVAAIAVGVGAAIFLNKGDGATTDTTTTEA